MELKGVSKFINILSLEVTKLEFKSRSIYFEAKKKNPPLYFTPYPKEKESTSTLKKPVWREHAMEIGENLYQSS